MSNETMTANLKNAEYKDGINKVRQLALDCAFRVGNTTEAVTAAAEIGNQCDILIAQVDILYPVA